MAKFHAEKTGLCIFKCTKKGCEHTHMYGKVTKGDILTYDCVKCGETLQINAEIKYAPEGILRSNEEVETIKKDREKQVQEGTKYDTGKPRIGEMIKDFGIPLLEVCKVWEFGTVKYSKSNWKKVDEGEDRYTNAMIRHFLAEDEEGIDAETEIAHYAHLAWNALSRIKFIMENKKNGN